MEPRILVTGATGTVGREVVGELCRRGAQPVALVHSDKGSAQLDGTCSEVRAADLRDPGQVMKAMERVDRVFMLTPVVPDQVALGAAIVEAAYEAGVKRIVKLSIIGAEQEPGFQLGRWHREMEHMVEESGIAWCFLRPAGFMQMMATFYGATVPATGQFFLPCGDAKVAKVDVRDIAAVAAEVLLEDGHEGQAYTLTGPEALGYEEIAAAMARAADRPVTYVDVPEEAARQSMAQMGMGGPLLDALMELFAREKAGESAVVTGDVQRVTGRAARAFEEFAQDYAHAWMTAPSGRPA